jgi:hypothetical protein
MAAGCGFHVIELPEQGQAMHLLLQDSLLLLTVVKNRVVSRPSSSPVLNFFSP